MIATTNLTTTTDKSKSDRLAIATAALLKATTSRKPVYIEYIDEGDKDYTVGYFDQYGEPETKVIPKKTLRLFIEDHYRNTFDGEYNGEHIQWEDSRTTAEYLEENHQEVITDYLNHLK